MSQDNHVEQKAKMPWSQTAHNRGPWTDVQYGEHVLPQMDQKSNIHLSDSEVMLPRVDPVSHAFPIKSGKSEPTEQAGKLNTQYNKDGISL